ncbi:MAG: hypothetical protein JST47_12275 [Bacteroidetes bacterium]|nr:hypothetical protein [Bacteroidota bacterium]MBS1974768.1 hypothetical protein [Bacteroidota bacterium]
MDEKYKPVSCNFYDELETLAIQHKDCDIVFWGESGAKVIVHDRIRNLFTTGDKSEFLETGKGIQIRLDKIIEVDGKKQDAWC